MHKDKPPVIPHQNRRRQPTQQQDVSPWLLKNKADHVVSQGQLEGGIAASNYFVLIKEGNEFVAVPLTAWYNFKPPPREGAMSLEEAEIEMEKKHNSHFSGTSRLGQAIAANQGLSCL